MKFYDVWWCYVRPKESKPPIVNQQCVVYHFKCDLCDGGYVGYTCRRVYQCIEEHKGSAIGKHVRDQHGRDPSDISVRFKILLKWQSKLDCLSYEMIFIKELKPTLNTQSDSIRAKIFLVREVFYTFFCKSFCVIVILPEPTSYHFAFLSDFWTATSFGQSPVGLSWI